MLSALIGGLAGVAGAAINNRANARQAQRQMEFQERMSSTAIQRQKADYEAAGFNPALAYGAGGASAPSGAMATMEDPVQTGISSARQASVFQAQAEQAKYAAVREKAAASSATAQAVIDTAKAAPWMEPDTQNAWRASLRAALKRDAERPEWETSLTRSQAQLNEARIPLEALKGNLWNAIGGAISPFIPSARSAAEFMGGLNRVREIPQTMGAWVDALNARSRMNVNRFLAGDWLDHKTKKPAKSGGGW